MTQAVEIDNPTATIGECGHIWNVTIHGEACPMCAAEKHSEAQEIRIAELEETVVAQAIRLARLEPEDGA